MEGPIHIQKIILGIAIIFAILLIFIDLFYAAMAFVLVLVLFMSFRIMGETSHLPDVVARLSENAKEIIVENRGNDQAQNIHVALVPLNIEFDVPSLEADTKYSFTLPAMIEDVKVVLTFRNLDGNIFSRSYRLSPLIDGEEDLLKPAFPLFGWK
jgi:hypothetical protein